MTVCNKCLRQTQSTLIESNGASSCLRKACSGGLAAVLEKLVREDISEGGDI